MELANGGFINHGMDNLMETRAGRLGGGGKAISQLSVASRAYLQNGGVSYRHEAPMLNDKYFPKVILFDAQFETLNLSLSIGCRDLLFKAYLCA